MVHPARRTFGSTRTPSASKKAPRHRREHQEVRQARRPDAGRVPGPGYDPALLAADATGAGTPHTSAVTLLHATADHGHQEQAAASTVRLQRRYPPAVHQERPSLPRATGNL